MNITPQLNPLTGQLIKEKLPDLLDFFIIQNKTHIFVKVKDGFDLPSDHSSIILILGKTYLKKKMDLP